MYGINRLIIVFGLAILSLLTLEWLDIQMGFYGPLPYPPYRTGKGWPISVPLYSYNKGTIKVYIYKDKKYMTKYKLLFENKSYN